MPTPPEPMEKASRVDDHRDRVNHLWVAAQSTATLIYMLNQVADDPRCQTPSMRTALIRECAKRLHQLHEAYIDQHQREMGQG